MEIDFETKLKGLAVAFFEDCKGDPNYELNSWQEQAEEMRNNLTEDQINKLFRMNPQGYLEMARKVSVVQ